MSVPQTRKGSSELALIGGVLLLGILAVGVWFSFRQADPKDAIPEKAKESTENVKKTTKLAGNGQQPKKETRKSRKTPTKDPLLIERDRLNKTVYKNEVLAQEHEKYFVKLWDDLLTTDDKYAVFEKCTFDKLVLAKESDTKSYDWGISMSLLAGAKKELKLADWHRLLKKLQADGYRVIETEWHHSNFVPSESGENNSVISAVLHVVNKRKKERYIVKGNLKIRWRKERDEDNVPQPSSIDASGLKIFKRKQEQVFTEVALPQDKTLEPKRFTAFFDLDGDGKQEVIFGNRVFRWLQKEKKFEEFTLSPQLNNAEYKTGLFSDFTVDGNTDFLFVAMLQEGGAIFLLKGDEFGNFSFRPQKIFSSEEIKRPQVLTSGDIDGDGDLDFWLGQYRDAYRGGQMPTPYYDANDGNPSFLFLNNGNGTFEDKTEERGLSAKRFRRTYSASLVDLDEDRDLDLVVVSDFSGVDVYQNDGKGFFTDVTSSWIDERHSFGMSHVIADFNLDAKLDFFMTGMSSTTARRLVQMGANRADFKEYDEKRMPMAYGNRMYLSRKNGFQEPAYKDDVARSGWSWGTSAFDFDNDGDRDIYIANGHISGKSTKDYCTQFWRDDIFHRNSKPNKKLANYFNIVQKQHAGGSWNGYEHNKLLMNLHGKGFLEIGFLMGVSFEYDSRSVATGDFDNDGKLDLAVVQIDSSKNLLSLHVYQNHWAEHNNWIGVNLREEDQGFSPVGAKVQVVTNKGTQLAVIVNGDSFIAQHPTVSHFGLGRETTVEKIVVTWQNGTVKQILKPEINRYHAISGRSK